CGISAREDDAGALDTGSPRGFQPNSRGAANDDDGLAEQFGLALSAYHGPLSWRFSSAVPVFNRRHREPALIRLLRVYGASAGASLHQRDERLAFFDDIGAKLGRVDAADVLRGVGRPGRNEQDAAGLHRHRRLALNVVFY